MNKSFLIIFFTILAIVSLIVGGVLLFDWGNNNEIENKLYTVPLSVGEKTYLVSVISNWTSPPKVYLPEVTDNYVSVDFIGSLRTTVSFNVTIPSDLIWGEISLIWKYYEQSADRYIYCYNGTHHSVRMIFNHTAAVEHFEIRGTEGVVKSQST